MIILTFFLTDYMGVLFMGTLVRSPGSVSTLKEVSFIARAVYSIEVNRASSITKSLICYRQSVGNSVIVSKMSAYYFSFSVE